MIFAGLVYLSRLKQINISSIEVTGNKILSAEEVESLIGEKTAGYYFWFFPKTNIFFYPKDAISEGLQEKFKRLKDVKLSIKNNAVLEVEATERLPSYMWCGDVPPEVAGEENLKCSFLDETGFIFDEAPYFSGEIYFKFYGANFSQANFDKLISFKKTIEQMELKPAALYVDPAGDVRIFLSAKNPLERPEIIFKMDSDFEKVVENLDTALKTEPLLSDFKNKYSSLLYIDLRFGNKVYYKFK